MSAIRKAQRDEERAELLGRGYTNGDNNHNGSSSGRRIDHSDFVSDQRSQQMVRVFITMHELVYGTLYRNVTIMKMCHE